MHFERRNAFQNEMHKIIFFPEKICVPTLPKIFRPVTQNTSIFLFGHMVQEEIRRIHHECEGRIEKSLPRIAIWHHEACR